MKRVDRLMTKKKKKMDQKDKCVRESRGSVMGVIV